MIVIVFLYIVLKITEKHCPRCGSKNWEKDCWGKYNYICKWCGLRYDSILKEICFEDMIDVQNKQRR